MTEASQIIAEETARLKTTYPALQPHVDDLFLDVKTALWEVSTTLDRLALGETVFWSRLEEGLREKETEIVGLYLNTEISEAA